MDSISIFIKCRINIFLFKHIPLLINVFYVYVCMYQNDIRSVSSLMKYGIHRSDFVRV